MLGLAPQTAQAVFLCLTLPVSVYVCWSDLKFMMIRNVSSALLVAIFAVAGLLLLPLDVWAWRWLNLAVVLVAGFLLHIGAGVGAGDAKFAAAAAPFVVPLHAPVVLMIFTAFLLGAFAMHRGARAIPALRRLAPDWVSWTRPDFPMGLALAGTLTAYLAFTAFPALYVAFLASRM